MRELSLPVCSPGVLQRNTGTCADARHEQYSGQAPVSAEDRGAKNTGGVYRWWCMSNADPLTWGMRPICTLECVEDERNACMHVDIAADAAPFPGPAVAAVHYGLPLLSPRPWLWQMPPRAVSPFIPSRNSPQQLSLHVTTEAKANH